MHNFDIFCLTETWLNDGFYSHELFDNNFTVLRRDRSSSTYKRTNTADLRGGGVCIAIKNSALKIIHQVDWQCSFIEDLWVTLISPSGKRTHICCCYIPGITPSDTFETYITSITDRVVSLNDDDVIFMGDQNVPEFYNDKLPRGIKYQSLNDLMDLCEFSQLNNVTNDLSDTVLDLVFSNCIIDLTKCDDSLVNPDAYHPPLLISIKSSQASHENKIKVFRNWKLANWAGIRQELFCVNWDLAFWNCPDVDALVDTLYDIITSVLNIHCPLIVKKIRSDAPKISPELKNALRKKRKANANWRRSNDPLDFNTFSLLKSQCEIIATEENKTAMEAVEADLILNPKKFYSFVNNRKTNGAGIAEFVSHDQITATTKEGAANLFAHFFGSTFSTSNAQDATPRPAASNINANIDSWDHIDISLDQVLTKLQQLKVNKCAGPDGLPPALFKKCAQALAYPLHLIFNVSLAHGVFPKKWKQAYVTPIHKNGSKNLVNNYRPISKISIASKLLDSLVADELFDHFSNHISEHQHGFYRKRSTVTNLLGYTERIQNCLRTGGQMDVIFTDFSKAFDKVSHDILLSKLRDQGICGVLLAWFESYLKGRTLRVQIGDALSGEIDVTSSVVQGSHCGPILFSLFINDISDILDVDFNSYADDIKIFCEINSSNDCDKLQKCLEKLSKFATDNQLSLNVSKCYVVSFTKRMKRFICKDYRIDDLVLVRQNLIKDLGITFDGTCNFNSHIDDISRRSKRSLGFVLRNSNKFTNPKTVVTLYSSLVRSLLEYASPIWSPTSKVRIKQIESVQHKYLRFMARKYFGDSGDTVDYKLYERKLKLQSLELRRVICDVKTTINSFNGKIDSFTFLHHFKLSVPRLRSRYRQVFLTSSDSSIFSRLMNNFNSFCNNFDYLDQKSCSKCILAHVESEFVKSQ